MKKIISFLKNFSVGALMLSPIGLVASCSSNDSKYSFYTSDKIAGINSWLESVGLSGAIESKANKIREKYNVYKQKYENDEINEDEKKEFEKVKLEESLLNQKTIHISAGGKVNDQSFNQLVWETVSTFSKSIGNPNNRYYETLAISQNMQNDAYEYALSNGFKNWILVGFQQESLLSNWLRLGNNKTRFRNAGIKIITIDWYPSNSIDGVDPGHLLGLNFRTQEAAFTIAYSAAKLVAEEFGGNGEESIRNRYFNTFAGGDFSGATNFNYGFYVGMQKWNEKNDESKKVASTIKSNFEAVDLGTSFSVTNDSRSKVWSAIDGYGNIEGFKSQYAPKVIMPVAGSLTSVALDRVKDKKSDQWIIGVDTNASLTFPNEKGLILTSLEKKISVAVYKALSLFYGLDDVLKEESFEKHNDLTLKWDSEENNYLLFKIQKGESEVLTNFNVVGGYKDGFVGVSKSTLSDERIAKKYDEIVEETWSVFFDNESNEECLYSHFINYPITNENVLGWYNNVLQGQMTAGDLTTFFNPYIMGGDVQYKDDSGKIIAEEKFSGINNWRKTNYQKN